MKNLKVEDILKVTKGELIIGDKNLECKSFSKDTRKEPRISPKLFQKPTLPQFQTQLFVQRL